MTAAAVNAPDRDRRSEEGGRVLGSDEGACWVCSKSAIAHPSHACRRCRAGKPEDWVAPEPGVVEAAAPTLEPTERHGFDTGRLCACGCGQRVYGFRASRQYASVECRVRAQRARDEARGGEESMGGGKAVEESLKGFPCERCGKVLASPAARGSHALRAHGVKGSGREALRRGKSHAPKSRELRPSITPATPKAAGAEELAPQGGARRPAEGVVFLSSVDQPEAFALAVCLTALARLEPSMRAAALELMRAKFAVEAV